MSLESDLRVEIMDTLQRRRKDDVKAIIEAVMAMPLEKGEVTQVDGRRAMTEMKSANTDVVTRIVLVQAARASNGDVKSAEFLFKYAGYTPSTDQRVTLELPQIIDDVSAPTTSSFLTSAIPKDSLIDAPDIEALPEPAPDVTDIVPKKKSKKKKGESSE